MESGNFAFTSNEAGDYLACFWTPNHHPATTVTLELDWRTGVAAKDWTNVAKKGQIDVSNIFDVLAVLLARVRMNYVYHCMFLWICLLLSDQLSNKKKVHDRGINALII